MINAPGLAELVRREARHADNFAELSEACLGAWPAWLHDILVDQEYADAKRLLASAATGTTRVAVERRLPLAHPLDGDWRFTRAGASRILDILLAETPAGCDILLIAMPTVALAANDRGLSERFVVASRPKDPVDRALRAEMPSARFEPLDRLSTNGFATVAVDPPWYDDVAVGLVELARSHVVTSGSVFACIPDRFTLPSAAQRLAALETAPLELGFAHASVVERVKYATPLFEARSLAALGIKNVSPSWRTGLLLQCAPERGAVASPSRTASRKNSWKEINHHGLRVWLRREAPKAPGMTLEAVVATSVSRRDPLRRQANLWTSGNTVASNAQPPTPSSIRAAVLGQANDQWHEALAAALKAELTDVERVVDYE